MKIKMEIDIDPKELREFFGFPDVAGLQKEAVKTVMKKMKSGADGFEPVTLLKQWMPSNLLAKSDLHGLYKRFMQAAETEEEYDEEYDEEHDEDLDEFDEDK
ncbi:MAG: hypothetical protein HKN88_03795 [Gammaproteobacteria bacterium]|nr:hypothetical protein [Gammaproteobacteria bacterium]NNC97176.1 hypothetical protein [Gammaproteobacteria bacterium]NNM13631.1 hypothetical protein [Gammaproteobacteria bacterium]